MIKKPGVIYPYLGYNEELLDSRRTGRCAQTVDPGGDGDRPVSLTIGSVLSSESGAGRPQLARLSNTHYIIVFRTASSGALSAYVCTYDSALTVTKGTTVALGTGSTSEFTVNELSDTKVLVTYARGPDVFARVLTVSGTTISAVGAENTLATTAYSAARGLWYSATSVLLYYRISGSVCFRAASISGDTVTVGSQITITATGTASSNGYCARVSDDRSLVIFSDGGGSKILAVSFSGGTVTEGTPLVISSWFSGGTDVSIAVRPDGTVAALSTRATDASLIVTTVGISGLTLTRDSGSSYTSADADILNSQHSACIGTNINAVVFNENVSGTRRPHLETQLFTTSGASVRQTTTLLSELLAGSIVAVRLTNSKMAWCAANDPSGSGAIITQVLNIT